MKIAVLSGKGGTGKTLVSVNLASVAGKAIYVDCDVEEPNGHLFFRPEQLEHTPVTVPIPVVDKERCTGCRRCVDFCQFNALAFIRNHPLLFVEVCHSCGGCVQLCPHQALTEVPRQVGEVISGVSDQVTVLSGRMNMGEATGTPIIHQLYRQLKGQEDTVVLDCPPGSACVVMDSIKDADYCVLVAEPTVFGVHNVRMVYELVKLLNKPFGVVLNKCTDGENPSELFCQQEKLPVLAKIPFDRQMGQCNSDGEIVSKVLPSYRQLFEELLEKIKREAGR